MPVRIPAGYPAALELGVIAGVRSLVAPAVLAAWVRACPEAFATRDLEKLFASPYASRALEWMALAELMADKLPTLGPRIAGPALLGRLLSGGLCGVASTRHAGGKTGLGAVIGISSAAVSALGSYHARRWLQKQLRVPSALLGVMEDALTILLAKQLRKLPPASGSGSQSASMSRGAPMSRDARRRLRARWASKQRYDA